MSWFDDEDDNLIAEGTYPVTLTNATLDETKADPRISVEFTHGNKRKSWLNLTFADTRKKFVNWQLRELGVYDRIKEIAAASGTTPARAALDALGELIGVECEISIEHNEWQGRTYANVKVESCGVQTSFAPPPTAQATAPRPNQAARPATARPAQTTTTTAARPAVKNHAPGATAAPPPSFDQNEELPDFMR